MASPSRAPQAEEQDEEGPFRASQIPEGSPYELSRGHPIRCMGAGERHGLSNTRGALVIGTDPALTEGAGVDVAFEFHEGKSLRAPDISAGNLKDKPGWGKGAPPLAVEYADRGQDERALKEKIKDLLSAGTQYVWVVRLTGPLRVEVYRPQKRKVVVSGDKVLSAPGVLQNPVPVRSLVEKGAANEAALRNLLNQLGYESLDAVRGEGLQEGLREGLREGHQKGLRQAVYTACELLQIKLNKARRGQIEQMDEAGLEALCAHLTRKRAWPP